MMKKFVLAALLFMGSAASAEVVSTIRWKSTQIFRGGVYTNNGVPMIQGEMLYKHDSGLFLGAFGANLISQSDEGGIPGLFDFRYELNHFIGYGFGGDGWNGKVMLMRYWFPEKMDMNSYDLIGTFSMANFTFLLSYMPDFFQWTATDQLYLSADYDMALTDKVSIVPHIGYSMYSKNEYDPVGGFATIDKGGYLHQNYMDYSIAFRHKNNGWVMDLGFAGTNRKLAILDTEQEADDRPFMNVSYTF